ncbi:hypothetical protein D9M71_453610 [compost metagenome]
MELRVDGQCALQQGGAGARQADDHQRVVEHLLFDFRVAAAVILDDQAIDQLADQFLVHQRQALLGQVGLGMQ